MSKPDFAQASMELFLWVARQDPDLGKKAYEIHLTAMADSLRIGMRSDDDENLIEPIARLIGSISDGLVNQLIAFRDPKRLLLDVDVAAEMLEQFAAAHQRAAA
jgi:hypothetical protein